MSSYITDWQHTVIPNFKVRPYQQAMYEAIIDHMRHEWVQCKQNKLYAPKPVVSDMTVGAGKSLVIAMLAKHITDHGMKFLNLARAGELVQQNFDEAWAIGCKSSIYSASLKSKSQRYPAIYGTEGTVARAIVPSADFGVNAKTGRANWIPDVLAIDECHMTPFDESDSQYMQIIAHFQRLNPRLMIIGLTGSPFRGAESIIGHFWHDFVGERITTDWAIKNGYLVPPQFGFPPDESLSYDYSSVKPDSVTGDYTSTDLAKVAKEQKAKLTPIMREVVESTHDRHVVLIFAASRSHCKQIAEHLPDGSWAIVTDSTPFKERQEIIARAKAYRKGGEETLRYIINVGVMITGVNIPTIDCIVYLRAVGSLVVLVQSIGRGLRLCDVIDKTDCLVLDYTETMVRLGELYNNPILEQAEFERSSGAGNTKICPRCSTINGEYARRCRGEVPIEQSFDMRCAYFWQSQECPICNTENDMMARECRNPTCKHELRDPNAALLNKAYSDTEWKRVHQMNVKVAKNGSSVVVEYTLGVDEIAREILNPNGTQPWQRAKMNAFLRQHINCKVMRQRAGAIRSAGQFVSQKAMFDVPTHITHRINDKGFSIIHNKRFNSGRLSPVSQEELDATTNESEFSV